MAEGSIRRLLEASPLYVKERDIWVPSEPKELWPYNIELRCEVCKKDQPFHALHDANTGKLRSLQMSSGLYHATYVCSGCFQSQYEFVLELDTEACWARKIGQLPPWTHHISSDLQEQLGEHVDMFRRALVCLGHGYGLGACTYLRRVLEGVIDPLLTLELEAQKADSGPASSCDALEAALNARDFKTKAEAAYRHAPQSLIVDGQNPFKLIHDHLSAGVHHLDEEACVGTAHGLVSALEFVVRELNRRKAERKGFLEAIKSAAKVSRGGG